MPRDRPYVPRDQAAPRGAAGDPLRDALDLLGTRRTARHPAPPVAAQPLPEVPAQAPRRSPEQPRPRPSALPRQRRRSPESAPGRRPQRRPASPATSSASRQPRPQLQLAGSRRRIRLATVFALALFTAIGVRLVVLQVSQSPEELELLLAEQRNRLVQVELPAARGSIVDRSGAVLARSVEARYVYADPELIQNPRVAADRLAPLLGVAPSRLARLMAKQKRPDGTDSRFEYLARGVDIPVAHAVDGLDLTGIGIGRDERRDVPGADLAANLIGFTGADRTGLEGLEARYDDVLRGQDGRMTYERGNPGVDDGRLAKEIPSGYHRLTRARPGATLHLTIDRDLQFQTQRALCPALARAGATFGAAVVLDVRTGEVLTQASCPGYNAAKPLQSEPAERADVASSIAAEPGSTHKAFVVAAALQEGLITAETTVPAGGPLVRGGTPFVDEHPQPPGTRLTIPRVLAYSSNVGTIAVADRLGPQRIFAYQKLFGLGTATGEGMPGESAGRLLPPGQWSPSAPGSVPIGTSVDATLIQMAAGYAAIANDGTYIAPRLVRSTVDADGTVTPAAAPETRRVLSPGVAAEVRRMLEAVVVVPGATGRLAAVPGYRVAGKTGTVDRLVDGRYTSANAVSFIGMAPAEAPRFVVAVSAAVPQGGGGEVAAPAFSDIMGLTLSRYRVPPSTTRPPAFR
ncbi:peptidoglycan D,D-transpeptidase FtsI family protein [Actinoplanes auranticolor]|nr:penicillin-binding protein 2 [Actinoplanes auranticolor]